MDGTVRLQSIMQSYVMPTLLTQVLFLIVLFGRQRNTEAFRASIQNLFGHINFIFHI